MENEPITTKREKSITIRMTDKEKEMLEVGAKNSHRSQADHIRILVMKDYLKNVENE